MDKIVTSPFNFVGVAKEVTEMTPKPSKEGTRLTTNDRLRLTIMIIIAINDIMNITCICVEK